MKTKLITVLMIAATCCWAQAEKKTATVRIKKIEKINGVEKITDTTYITSDPQELAGEITEIETTGDGRQRKIIINDHEEMGSVNDGEERTEISIKKADCKSPAGGSFEKKVMIRKVVFADVSPVEKQKLGASVNEEKTGVTTLGFYPNPSKGKFRLEFNLPGREETSISIMDVQGKSIYSETLKDFTGRYSKEIDLSEHPGGFYFLNIRQGNKSELKKIIIE